MGLKNELPISDMIGECLINLNRYQEAIYALSRPWAIKSALHFGADVSSVKGALLKRAYAFEMVVKIP